MRVFQRLRVLRDFERSHLGVLETVEDHNLVREIGYHQARATPLTLKQLFLLDTGSIATVQRRLRRLRQLGVVQQRRAKDDRRAVELLLTPKYLRLFRRYGELMSEDPGYRHVCGIYGDDRTLRDTTASFLAECVSRGQRCVLFAAPAAAEAILDRLERKHKGARGKVIVRGYASTLEAQLARFREALSGGRRGDSVRVAGDLGSALASGLTMGDLLAYERKIETEIPASGAQVLCQYDARRFDGEALLRALECHADSTRYPLVLSAV